MNGDPHFHQFALTRSLYLRNGVAVTVRPMGLRDGARLQAYVRDLSRESRRNRFLGAMKELPDAELFRLGRLDYDDQGALIAQTWSEGAWRIIGEARYAMTHERRLCEVALSVADPWQRRGLGLALMQTLEDRARDLGADVVVADALHTNEAVKRLARRTAFSIRP